jgi:hypothetical protein
MPQKRGIKLGNSDTHIFPQGDVDHYPNNCSNIKAKMDKDSASYTRKLTPTQNLVIF